MTPYFQCESVRLPVSADCSQEHLERRIAERKVLDQGCSIRQAALQALNEAKEGLSKVRVNTQCFQGEGQFIVLLHSLTSAVHLYSPWTSVSPLYSPCVFV